MIFKAKAEGSVKVIKISGGLTISHLLFVNDIMILDSGYFSEWKVYFDIIKDFCKVSRLSINPKKSRLLVNEVSDSFLVEI